MRDTFLQHDALGLAELVRSGAVQPSELLSTALELTAELNPRLNAVVTLDESGAHADLDAVPAGAPFAGVPFLLKDLYAAKKGLRLTNGSRFYEDNVPTANSYLVDDYLAAGLVVFGRSASPEFGLTTSTESALFGDTHNPWKLGLMAGGSSGGAASAVAAGIVPAAHASDGGGSIRIPASCCGLFGLKPSRARVSSGPDRGEGWNGLSTNHVVSRTVRDSAALLDATCRPRPGDPYWAPQPERPYLEEVGRSPGRLKIALTGECFNGAPTDPEVSAALGATAKLCQELGHEVVEARPEISTEELASSARTVVAASLRAGLEARAAELGRELRADDVEPLTWGTAQGVRGQGPQDYAAAVQGLHRIGRALGLFFEDYDALLTPTMGNKPLPIGALSLRHPEPSEYLANLVQTIGYTQLMNVAGNPAVSVPLAWSADGLPIGIQFAARFGAEDLLLRLSAQLEQALPWRDRHPPVSAWS